MSKSHWNKVKLHLKRPPWNWSQSSQQKQWFSPLPPSLSSSNQVPFRTTSIMGKPIVFIYLFKTILCQFFTQCRVSKISIDITYLLLYTISIINGDVFCHLLFMVKKRTKSTLQFEVSCCCSNFLNNWEKITSQSCRRSWILAQIMLAKK